MPAISELHRAALEHLQLACGTHLAEFSRADIDGVDLFLALESDLTVWLEVLSGRPETSQYRSAHRDVGLAYYSVTAGLYRQAFAGLRTFIEVSFGNLHLSVAELERRIWVSGRKDLSWAAITSVDSGIYSVGYLREFCSAALEEREHYQQELKVSYRRCSEYLHGNVEVTAMLPDSIEYSPQVVAEWFGAAGKALQTMHHSLFVRYFDELNESGRSKIESILEQHLSHHVSVRKAIGMPVESR